MLRKQTNHAVEPHDQRSFNWSNALNARHIALPSEHGAWVFLLSPLMIGVAAGGFRPASLLLIVAVLAAFLIRQPITMAVKVSAGRRPRHELSNIVFWLLLYGLIALVAVTSLVAAGYGFLVWLALPAVPVFVWHLWLVRRRAERRQMLVEVVASGVLALAAPAAYWVGQGGIQGDGWLLWSLTWLQVAGTIVYAYLRLEQRTLHQQPSWHENIQMARAALWVNLAALLLVTGLALKQVMPVLLPLAYLIQPFEVIWGVTHPAVGVKPKVIGIRQLIISSLFTLAFILAWS
jgi:nitrate reductase NapE component